MTCAIHQPQFLPWLGYLHKIRMADAFVFLDTVQFRKNEFQNRNRIPSPAGVQWLTAPVMYRFGQAIREVRLADRARWQERLWRTVEQTYGKTPHFAACHAGLKDILMRKWEGLAELNLATVRWLADSFGIRTPSILASAMPEFSEDRSQRLVDICRHVGADTYLSGAQARCYLDVPRFEAAGMRVEFQQFEHPRYEQAQHSGEFVSHMSAVDGLFNCGGGDAGREKLNL